MAENVRSSGSAYAILRAMKGGLKAHGFTVAETMIVLAVTGGLFLVVAASLSGRQARTQFEQSINEVRSQIQQTINEVGAGFYPNTGNFACTAGANPTFAAGTTEQGENAGCTFLGKAIQFQVGTSDPEIMKIYTIAGLQRTAAGDEPTTYGAGATGARPRVVDGAGFNATETKPLLYGLKTVDFTGSTNVGTVAFVNSLASNASTIVSGAQQVNLIPIPNSPRGSSEAAGINRINVAIGSGTVNPASGVSFCFQSGASNQSGLITIGGNGRQLSVDLSIRSNRTCAP